MDALAGIEFRDPAWLRLLAAVPLLLAFFVWRERVRMDRANRFISERLRGGANRLRALRPWAIALGAACAIVALAGPRAGYTLRAIPGAETSTVLVLDTSLSMNAVDVGTSRLTAAKALARRIIEKDPGRVGLVIFEGNAEVVAPLTDDHRAVETLVESIGAGELSEAGSDVGRAIEMALAMISRVGGRRAALVVLSDGEHRGNPIDDAVEHAIERGVPVTTVLVGGSVETTIPSGDNRGPLRDDKGKVVKTLATAEVLRDIASRTGGEFYANPFSSKASDEVVASLPARASAGGSSSREARVPVEQFQWPLGAAFALFLAGSLLHRGAE